MLFLIALWALPLATFFWARRRVPRRLGVLTGVAFGAVVAPAAVGLYALYYVGPIPALLGLVGLPLAMLHEEPGYNLAIWLGVLQPRTVVEGVQQLYVALLNGVVWATVYGLIGSFIDGLRTHVKKHETVSSVA